jgi:hypothetical protein
MKRFRRKLFSVFAALSLVLCVVTTALWARSFFVVEAVFRSRWDATTQRLSKSWVRWSDGKLMASYECTAPPAQGFFPPANVGWQHSTTSLPPPDFAWYLINHQPRSYFQGRNGTLGWTEMWIVGFRIWPVAVLAAVLPAWWLFAKMRPRRFARNNLCPVCGYDLRATPDRCPECGTIAVKGNLISN